MLLNLENELKLASNNERKVCLNHFGHIFLQF